MMLVLSLLSIFWAIWRGNALLAEPSSEQIYEYVNEYMTKKSRLIKTKLDRKTVLFEKITDKDKVNEALESVSSLTQPTLGVDFWQWMMSLLDGLSCSGPYRQNTCPGIWKNHRFLMALRIRECLYDFQSYRPFIGLNSKLSNRLDVDKTLLSSSVNPIMKGAEQLGYLMLLAAEMRPYTQRDRPANVDKALKDWFGSTTDTAYTYLMARTKRTDFSKKITNEGNNMLLTELKKELLATEFNPARKVFFTALQKLSPFGMDGGGNVLNSLSRPLTPIIGQSSLVDSAPHYYAVSAFIQPFDPMNPTRFMLSPFGHMSHFMLRQCAWYWMSPLSSISQADGKHTPVVRAGVTLD